MIWAVDTGGNLGVSPADGRPDVMFLMCFNCAALALCTEYMSFGLGDFATEYMSPREWREYAEGSVGKSHFSWTTVICMDDRRDKVDLPDGCFSGTR